PAGRADDDEDGDEPGARDAEDRARQERVRLARARAEVGREDRVGDVDPDPEHGDPRRRAKAVAAGIELGADEEERKAGCKRRPGPGEVPDRARRSSGTIPVSLVE